MRGYFVTVIALSTIMMPLLPARSDEIPTLKIELLCRGIVSQGLDPLAGGEPKVAFDQCMQAEKDDREQLKKEWPTFSSDDKKHCVALSTMGGGEASYTELITCLEMARDVKALRSPVKSKDIGHKAKSTH